jgi:hypothetical protein
MQLLSSSDEYQFVHVIPSLENIILFKNNIVKLDLLRDQLLDHKPATTDDLKNR